MHIQAWEQQLLGLAYENSPAAPTYTPIQDIGLLQRAYAQCEEITAIHSRSFHLASRLLPPEKRRAARALYAFCRRSDDIVDQHSLNASSQLAQWRERVLMPHPPAEDLVATAWADTRARYHIPALYVVQLIDGVARDLQQNRYNTFDDLAAYAYGVASTVGLMSMHIIGFIGPQAIPYAIKLGVALQLTNILRDIGEDWRAGRVYLPQQELTQFGLTEADLQRGVVTENWRAFMRFQLIRTRRLYAEARPGIAMLDPDGRFAIRAAADLYEAILTDIERHDYDVFQRRAHVSGWRKLAKLPLIWWRSRV